MLLSTNTPIKWEIWHVLSWLTSLKKHKMSHQHENTKTLWCRQTFSIENGVREEREIHRAMHVKQKPSLLYICAVDEFIFEHNICLFLMGFHLLIWGCNLNNWTTIHPHGFTLRKQCPLLLIVIIKHHSNATNSLNNSIDIWVWQMAQRAHRTRAATQNQHFPV